MKKVILMLTGVLLFYFFSSCTLIHDGIFSNEENETPAGNQVVLGAKIQNPFSISTARTVNPEAVPNYAYFRVRTDNPEKVRELLESYGTLDTVPFEYEIVQGGSVFPENQGTEEISPWYYFVKPLEEAAQLFQDFEYELIEEMYIPESYLQDNESDISEETISRSSMARAIVKKNPTGSVKVYNTVTKKYESVPDVKVNAWHWVSSHSDITDGSGTYDIKHTYSSFWGKVRIKVDFTGETDSVYDQFAFVPAWYIQGWKDVKTIQNNEIKLGSNLKAARYATIKVAAKKYRDYAKADGVTLPPKLKFWACTLDPTGCTLMSSQMVEHSMGITAALGSAFGGIPGAMIGVLTTAALSEYLPDIVVGINDSDTEGYYYSEFLTEIVFHEMAHASHFTALGKNRIQYWAAEFDSMISGWCEVLLNKGNVFKNTYNDGKSPLVCLIESWGYFYGYYLMSQEYQTNKKGIAQITDNFCIYYNYINLLLLGFYDKITPYFYEEAFYSLLNYTNTLNSERYTIGEIFNILKDSSVVSKETFIKRFLNMYPNNLLRENIEVLFTNAEKQ